MNIDVQLLGQVVQMCICALAPDTVLQQQAQQALETHKTNPEFLKYLSYIFAHGAGQADDTRAVAGLVLKQSLGSGDTDFVKAASASIQSDLLHVLSIPSLSGTAANCIASAIRGGGYCSWPSIGSVLADMLSAGSAGVVKAALTTSCMLMEDIHNTNDDDDRLATAAALTLLPHFLSLMTNADVKLRLLSCRSVKFVMDELNAPDWVAAAPHILTTVASLAGDRDDQVLVEVVAIMGILCEYVPAVAWPHIAAVLSFANAMLRHENDKVVLAAISFWEQIADSATEAEQPPNDIQTASKALLPFFPSVIPSLLDRLPFARDELVDLRWAQGNDAHLPDSAKEMRPFIKGRGKQEPSGRDDDEDGEQDQSDAHLEVSSWSLRKAAASALEQIAYRYSESSELIAVLIPELQRRLTCPPTAPPDTSYLQRESAVLALGAISVMQKTIYDHMGHVFPFILSLASDPQPVVRSMALWTIMRYSGWIYEEHCQGSVIMGTSVPMLDATIQVVCAAMGDSSKKVQHGALVLLGGLIQELRDSLGEFDDALWATILSVYPRYHAKSRCALYDVIGSAAEAGMFTHIFEDAHSCQAVTTPMLQHLDSVRSNYDDPELICLLDCLAKLFPCCVPAAAAAASAMVVQVTDMMQHDMLMLTVASDAGEPKHPCELMEAGLEALSGLCNSLQESIMDVITPASPLLECIAQACSMPFHPEVRRSAFAVLGELVGFAWPLIAPHADVFLQSAKVSMSVLTFSTRKATNNAVWVVGRMTAKMGPDVQRTAPLLLPLLAGIVSAASASPMLLGNAAFALGRMAIVAPAMVGTLARPEFSEWLPAWARACTMNTDEDEYPDAYLGLCMAVGANPGAAMATRSLTDPNQGPPVPHLVVLGMALAHLDFKKKAAPHLQPVVSQLLAGFKSSLAPAAWGMVWNSWNVVTQKQLSLLGAAP